MNVLHVQVDELEALIVIYLITDALGVIMVDHQHELPPECTHGVILLADELLTRVWPSIDETHLGDQARVMRQRVAACAASVRRDYQFGTRTTLQ